MAPISPAGGTPIPFQVARAYLEPARPMGAPSPVPSPIPTAAATRTDRTPGIARLVAGAVPGRIEFPQDGAVARPGALSIYRHPADRNVAATGVEAGRSLDLEA